MAGGISCWRGWYQLQLDAVEYLAQQLQSISRVLPLLSLLVSLWLCREERLHGGTVLRPVRSQRISCTGCTTRG
jgi:hypothetical protein